MCKFFRNPLCKNGSRLRTNILRLSSEIYPSPQNIIFRQPYVGKVSFTNDSVNGIVRDGHSAVHNDEESVGFGPRSLWAGTLVRHFGQSIWSGKSVSHFGQALWLGTVISHFGQALWLVNSVRHVGQVLWSGTLVRHFGLSLLSGTLVRPFG